MLAEPGFSEAGNAEESSAGDFWLTSQAEIPRAEYAQSSYSH